MFSNKIIIYYKYHFLHFSNQSLLKMMHHTNNLPPPSDYLRFENPLELIPHDNQLSHHQYIPRKLDLSRLLRCQTQIQGHPPPFSCQNQICTENPNIHHLRQSLGERIHLYKFLLNDSRKFRSI